MSADSLRVKLEAAFSILKEAVDLTVDMAADIKKNEANGKQATQMWESFLSDFWSYIRRKSRESGHNLLAGISFFRIRRD